MPGTDRYTRTARLGAAVLAASPALVLGLLALPLLPGLHKLWSVVSLGAVTFAELVARSAGNTVQQGLWDGWGGAPTIRRLRFHDGEDPTVVAGRHRDFEAALKGVKLPDAESERSDPVAADAQYADAVRRLIARVRADPQFVEVARENRSYGFARNLYGLKRWGLLCALAVLIASAAAALVTGLAVSWKDASYLIVPAAAAGVSAILWRLVTPAFVKPSAEAYADRLLDAASALAQRPPAG